jgi:hypothetical protein
MVLGGQEGRPGPLMAFGRDQVLLDQQIDVVIPDFGTQPLPSTAVDCVVYSVHCTLRQILELSFEQAEYIKPKIQRRHLFSDQVILRTSSLLFGINAAHCGWIVMPRQAN